jgi:LysR family transcriptional regulator for metE and metH
VKRIADKRPASDGPGAFGARQSRSWPRPQLEIRDLELALSLVGAGSTAGAASQLHITQSAVSRALTQAEDKIGTRLFDRRARGVVPTPAGERLVAGAGSILAQLRDLERAVAAPAEAPTRVRLVCECYTAYRWVPSVLVTLRRRFPGFELTLAVEQTGDPVHALCEDDIDVALLTTAVLPAAERSSGVLVERPLFSDEIVFVVGASHPLARAKVITKDDLRRHPIVGSSSTPPGEQRWFLNAVFGRHQPKLSFLRFPLTEAIMDATRSGMGIAVMSEWMASGYLDSGDLVAKRLASGPVQRPWRIAYRREAAEPALRLADLLAGSVPRLFAVG